MMKIKTLMLVFALTTVVLSCEKKEPEPEPETPVQPTQQPADVLNTNSGYSSVYDYIQNVQGIGSAIGNLDLNDFTVESNGMLHYVRNSGFQSQQSYLTTNTRVSINLSTKEEVALPSYTSYFNSQLNSNNQVANVMYKHYSNYATIIANQTTCNGDISAIGGSVLNFGNTDFDFFYPQFNLGKVDNTQPASQQTYIFVGLQNPPNSTLYGCVAQTYTFTNPSSSQVILAGVFDWKRTTLPVKTNAFLLRNDSMIVYNCNTASIQKITGVAVFGLTTGNTISTFRNYSLDGNIVGLVFKDITTNKYWSYSYNFTTQILTKGLEDVSLDYSAAGSDIDTDEFGNIYYSGVAGNGSNTNGVSIYKKNVVGSTIVVGADNFLKFGTITKLKCAFGKVYLVVCGTISGTYYKQITFLKQN